VFCFIMGAEDLGFGKVTDVAPGKLTIEYFDSPSMRHLREASTSAIVKKILGPNTRVYLYDAASANWDVGRVLFDDGDAVEVRLSGRYDVVVPHERVFVRWKRPISDPVEFLSCGIAETPQYADARTRFLASYLAQRAATGGISALLSSGVELNPHQINVVRRVLTDPTQRYLLADEVGLGKTIEAGIVVRQAVLDDPRGHNVVIVVPQTLVQQWRIELTSRFGLSAYLDDSVFVVSYTDESALRARLAEANMLVIDEAHHVTSDGESTVYKLVSSSAARVRRLLLLSATPVLRNEGGFLRMLHLLDPIIYPLDREEEFRLRVSHRQQLAEVVAILDPENSLYFEPFLDDLMRILPGDQRLEKLTKDVRDRLQALPTSDDADFVVAVRVLRTHLSETYRLHRRILRNRRRHVKWLTPPRNGSSEVALRGTMWTKIETALENWRIGAVASTRITEVTAHSVALIDFYSQVIGAMLANPSDVLGLCESRMLREKPDLDLFSAERDLLAAVKDATRVIADRAVLKNEIAASVISDLTAKDKKVVVFCSDTETADRLFAHLWGVMGHSVVRHEVGDPSEGENEAAGTAWLLFQTDASVKVVICDRSAEEGLNLQGGRKAILHFDLPLDPNRIEQRMGRLDRYSTGDPIDSVVLVDNESTLEAAWYEVLRSGLRVFERSISSLQYLLEEQMRDLKTQLFLDGVAALTTLGVALTGEHGLVEMELRRLEQQDALDELVPTDEDESDVLVDVDSNWQEVRDATDQWAVGALLFDPVISGATARANPLSLPFRFKYVAPGNSGHATLIPLASFVDRFLGAIDYDAAGGNSRQPLSYAHSYHRKTAIKCGVRPLRYGSEFGEALKAFSDVDDRGRSYVCWRQVTQFPSGLAPALHFRFSFCVEANSAPAKKLLASSAELNTEDAMPSIRRQLDMALPPSVTELWIDENGAEPRESIRALLAGAYDKTGECGLYLDTNIRTGRLGRIRSKMPHVFGNWDTLCRRLRGIAINRMTSSMSLARTIQEALSRIQTIQEVRLSQLAARVQHLDGVEAAGERAQIGFEQELAVALQNGISTPAIRIDVAGAVWLTSEPYPFQGQDEERGWK
jgi:ATP-dependent helicase HepA